MLIRFRPDVIALKLNRIRVVLASVLPVCDYIKPQAAPSAREDRGAEHLAEELRCEEWFCLPRLLLGDD